MKINAREFKIDLYKYLKNRLGKFDDEDLLTATTVMADTVMFNFAFILCGRKISSEQYPLKLAEFFNLLERMFHDSVGDIKAHNELSIRYLKKD